MSTPEQNYITEDDQKQQRIQNIAAKKLSSLSRMDHNYNKFSEERRYKGNRPEMG